MCPRFCSGRNVRWISPEQEREIRNRSPDDDSQGQVENDEIATSSGLRKALDDAGILPEMHADGTLKALDEAKASE